MTELLEISPASLGSKSQSLLDDLYRRVAEPGDVPTGDTQGTALLLPGSKVGRPLQRLAFLLLWKGKLFYPQYGDLKNKIGPFGTPTIRAEVYRGESWMDSGQATILDYSRTSRVARWIRDEIRQIAPGVWLGKVFVGRWHVLDFVLRS